jgi:hypothetical protein
MRKAWGCNTPCSLMGCIMGIQDFCQTFKSVPLKNFFHLSIHLYHVVSRHVMRRYVEHSDEK